jgi:hypothetical protein
MRYVRAAALCGVLGFSFFATGCSGNGGGATPPVPPVADQAIQDGSQTNQQTIDQQTTNQQTANQQTTDQQVTAQQGTGSTIGTMSTTATSGTHVHGSIVAIKSSTEFEINGGSGVGYVNIYTTSSTVKYYNGLTPKVGYYADVYGTGSAATYITATQVTLSTSSTSPTSGTHVHGSIVAIKSSTEFEINGGTGVGYVNVYTTSSTVKYYNGLTPKVGYYADVYGTGSAATYITATQVTLSTSSTSSTTSGTHVHGSIVAIKSSTEFEINGGTGVGYVNVYTTSSTVKYYNGLTPKVGYYADVYGTGSAATYITATQVTLSTSSSTTGGTTSATPSPSGSVPTHVMTAAIVWGYGGTPTSVSIASVKPYVTWVQTSSGYGGTMRSNGLKVNIYENFWRNYSSDNPSVGYTDLKPGGAHAPAEAKTCTGSTIYDSTYGGGYEADARSSAAAGHAAVFNNYRINSYSGQYDAIFSDDTGAMGGIPLPCNWSLSSYQSATNAVHASLKVPIFVNTLGAASNPVNQVGYTNASNVIGAMCEICFAAYNSSKVDYVQTGTYWQNIENAAIQLINNHKIFWDYARAIGNPSYETPIRKYVYASFLLTYSPQYSMLQEAFQSAYNFPVMPETGFVPLNPVTTASTVTGYLRTGGAYMREFGACYYRGSYKGKCAVVVNPTGYSVTVPTTAYTHSLGLVGGGVLDGGYVTFTSSRPSSLGPGQGAILLP